MPARVRGLATTLVSLWSLAKPTGRSAVAEPRVALTCYTKPGCTLCDKARASIARATRGLPVTVRWVNILDDPTLLARWSERIPVVTAGEPGHSGESGDMVLAEGRIGELRLRRELEAYLRQPPRPHQDGERDER